MFTQWRDIIAITGIPTRRQVRLQQVPNAVIRDHSGIPMGNDDSNRHAD